MRDEVHHVLRAVGEVARHRLEHERPERVDVGAEVDGRRALDLLWRHEHEAPEALPRLRQRRLREGLRELRDAKIEDLDAIRLVRAPLEEDVGRLEIAVDDVDGVRGLEPAEDLLDDGRESLEAHRPGALQVVEEALSLEELEHERDPELRVVLDAEHLGHVIALDHPRGARLAAEALDDVLAVLVVRPEQLQRDHALGARVARLPDLAHPSSPEGAHDLVGAGDEGAWAEIHGASARYQGRAAGALAIALARRGSSSEPARGS